MKSKGYILFVVYPDGEIGIDGDYCKTKTELLSRYNQHWDDKWDLEDRNEYHYFYLDLSAMIYYPLKKWKNPCNSRDRFKSDNKLELSTKIFETPNNTARAVKPVVIPPNISSKKKTDCIYVGIGEDIKEISVNFDDSYDTIQERVSKAIKELSQKTIATVTPLKKRNE